MSEPAPVYELDTVRAAIAHVEANRLNDHTRAYLDALTTRRMELYRAAWQGDAAALDEFKALYFSLASLTALLPVEVVA